MLDSGAVDLDLDFASADGENTTSRTPLEATQPLQPRPAAPAPAPTPAPADSGAMSLDFSIDPTPATKAVAAPVAAVAEKFDLSGISLDLDLPKVAGTAKAAAAALPGSDFGSIELPSLDSGAESDPISRKLELAEEFRQIGDTEGARDLLQEVVAKAEGALKAKAQGMLDDLA